MNEAARTLLPPPAAGRPAWRVLDTRLDATRLFALWQAWGDETQRPLVLHIVALTTSPPSTQTLRASAPPEQATLADELLVQWTGLLPGMHRLSLAEGRLQLTLGVGELQTLLREQQFEADAVFLDSTLPWDRWSLKALARCCRRGTQLAFDTLTPELHKLLPESGFVLEADHARYDPPWDLKTSRETLRTEAATPGTCVVIGAGLAGASVAATLTRRGWLVEVLDAAPEPAAGASGLPAGLLVPHVSTDDSPRSRLTRAGLRLMRSEAQRLLQAGQDWEDSGVLEQRLDDNPGLPAHWPVEGQQITRPASTGTEPWRAGMAAVPALWHAQAAWIKPARLVQAWLKHSGVSFRGQTKVERLQRTGTQWQLLDREGKLLTSASHVVLANAADAPRLLAPLGLSTQIPALQEMRGVMSNGLRQPGDESALPPYPVNGLGSLIPAVPTADGLAWYAGATYEDAAQPAALASEHHRTNLDKLSTLLPAAAQRLAPSFAPGAARGWGGTRCVSADRLPLVGPLQEGTQPTLWISAAMGSRGLSFAMLCAELLAARLGAEPWPVETSLARFLHARRAASHHEEI
ncbi:FAD-dependent 5-carboxymethylaminomethyl-2-thiouridine(34) oxidoreductase MnmC [Rhodoferax sp. BAB1]|uniref:FAD-dependent 5-carboxymethylaminomethyl-2-thiouridine(34) oxidoreductase MnmC n=1 Tax=Rhodoferax sp. BAB1 TaxID=2741720 RepID=UPI0015768932|nr:FAD-dependent 5-carboxymethylaminomethyl-2-thiouridine(34) oxidoreductase MnmC [Rhodoferax sp. BAB1]QKO21844.1 FAD-dependent 5-carboxymethylaminomethyl-2-thiouridine(34) oxidoreductase MnmC [Rhodoferax sp. BAB1]